MTRIEMRFALGTRALLQQPKSCFNVFKEKATAGGSMSRFAKTPVIATLFAIQIAVSESQIVSAPSQISGMWRGNSECVVRSSPCHDETNVYRFSEVAQQPSRFSGTGSKLVNGKEVSMGTLDWQYDAKNHILESKNPNGVFRFVVVGDSKMEGTLFLPDATVYRRIHLAKVK